MSATRSRPGAIDSAARRAEYEAEFAALRAVVSDTPVAALAERFLRLEARLDAGMIEVKSALLISGLLTTADDVAIARWIQKQHADLAGLGRWIAHAALATAGFDVSRALRLVALALLHIGEALKWELMGGRAWDRDYAALHGLARMALLRERLQETGTLVVDGLERFASLEALYFRALLLDRFSSGSLSRQQIEVLDAWLWEWAPSLASVREPHGAVLRADLDSRHGLRHGRRDDSGPCLYLPLAPLEAQRLGVIEQFHAGRVVPARGRASEIRLEAHVAVLAHLKRTFSGDETRAPRQGRDGEVEAWRGLQDITHLLVTEADIPGGIADEHAGSRARSGDAFDRIYDLPRRRLGLANAGVSGWLFRGDAASAEGLVVGELVALRFEPRRPCILARVARRVVDASGEPVSLGLQRLSHEAPAMRPCRLRSDAGELGIFIFVPGEDSSGRHDSFVVPYRLLESGERCFVRRGGRDYALRFNRVRRRGRGWALAGFEMVDARAWDIVVA